MKKNPFSEFLLPGKGDMSEYARKAVIGDLVFDCVSVAVGVLVFVAFMLFQFLP